VPASPAPVRKSRLLPSYPSEGSVGSMPSFDEAWPELAERLRRSLAARGVPAQDRDDVVQETALRVYRVWDSLDPTRTPWPFVVTVAVNFWRDIVRERTGRIAQVHPSATIEVTDDQDVERDVLARQELARVRVAWRALAPEQQRLLLATEEFSDTVRPLRPAERVARMRVRRQLARAVGRASAVVAVMWLRRPARSSGVVAAAYASAMAAAVFTTPNMVNTPLVTAMPHHQQVHATHAPQLHRAATTSRHSTWTAARGAAQAAATQRSSAHGTGTGTEAVALPGPPARPQPARLCAPVRPPMTFLGVVIRVGSTTIYGTDPSGNSQEILATPSIGANATSGCVHVGSIR